MMLFEETTKSLFPSDLFIQPGDQPPVVSEDLGTEMCAFYREVGIFAHEEPVRRVVDRVEALDPDWVHGMHGGSLGRGSFPAYVRALREEPFAYRGSCSGARSDFESRSDRGELTTYRETGLSPRGSNGPTGLD
jgi:hypothetical protein